MSPLRVGSFPRGESRVVVDDLDEVGPLGQACGHECLGFDRRGQGRDEAPCLWVHLRRVAAWRRRASPCGEHRRYVRPIRGLDFPDLGHERRGRPHHYRCRDAEHKVLLQRLVRAK